MIAILLFIVSFLQMRIRFGSNGFSFSIYCRGRQRYQYESIEVDFPAYYVEDEDKTSKPKF